MILECLLILAAFAAFPFACRYFYEWHQDTDGSALSKWAFLIFFFLFFELVSWLMTPQSFEKDFTAFAMMGVDFLVALVLANHRR